MVRDCHVMSWKMYSFEKGYSSYYIMPAVVDYIIVVIS